MQRTALIRQEEKKCLLSYQSITWLRGVMTRTHSFPPTAEFRAAPRDLGYRGIWVLPRNWAAEYTAEFVFFEAEFRGFDVFHSNNYLFTENDLKVALLQVCLWWFFVWWWWLN